MVDSTCQKHTRPEYGPFEVKVNEVFDKGHPGLICLWGLLTALSQGPSLDFRFSFPHKVANHGEFSCCVSFPWPATALTNSRVPDRTPWQSPLQQGCSHWRTARCRAGACFEADEPEFTSWPWNRAGHLQESYRINLLLGSSYLVNADISVKFMRITYAAPGSVKNELLPLLWPFSMEECFWTFLEEAIAQGNLLPMHPVNYTHRSQMRAEGTLKVALFEHPLITRLSSCLFSCTISLRWLYNFTHCLGLGSVHSGWSLLVIVKIYVDACMAVLHEKEKGYLFSNPLLEWPSSTTF